MSDRCVKISLAALCLALSAGAVRAEASVSPSEPIVVAITAANGQAAQSEAGQPGAATIRPTPGPSVIADIHAHDLSAYGASSLHPIAPSTQLTAQVMAALAAPDPAAATAAGSLAAGAAAPSATPSPPVGSDAPAVSGSDTQAATKPTTTILDFTPLNRLAGIANGMSTGRLMPLPDEAALSRDTAAAILRAFHAPAGTADQAASDAADTATTGDPQLDERIALARTVFKVDGTDELLRHEVSSEDMKVIIEEVAKHININRLSESDKYRLSAIAAAAQTQLEEKVLNLNARVEASNLSKHDLTLLIVAYDNDAIRKQTKLRLADTGKADRDDALDLTMAQIQIVKGFERAQ